MWLNKICLENYNYVRLILITMGLVCLAILINLVIINSSQEPRKNNQTGSSIDNRTKLILTKTGKTLRDTTSVSETHKIKTLRRTTNNSLFIRNREHDNTHQRVTYSKQLGLANKEQQLRLTSEYQKLFLKLNQSDDDEKVPLLMQLWQLATEINIVDEEFLIYLSLATYDTNSHVADIATRIIHDLEQLKSKKNTKEQDLVTSIIEIDQHLQRHSESLRADLNKTNYQSDHTSIDTDIMEIKRKENISLLKQLALETENPDTKHYAINSLMQLDQDSALDVIQYQLINSDNIDERFKSIELLQHSIGEYDSSKIRNILESVSYDYDQNIANRAHIALRMLDDYAQSHDDTLKDNQNNEKKYIKHNTSQYR